MPLYAVRAEIPAVGSRAHDSFIAVGPSVLVEAPSPGAASVRAGLEAQDPLGLTIHRACAAPKPEHLAKGHPCARRPSHGHEHDHLGARVLGRPEPPAALAAVRDLLTAYGYAAVSAAWQQLEDEHAARIAEHDGEDVTAADLEAEAQAQEEAEREAADEAEREAWDPEGGGP